MADKTYTVTVATGSKYGGGTGNVYYLDGARNSTGPGTISWVQGATLRFDQSDSSNDNHPLVFSTSQGISNIISTGVTYYLDGTSNQDNYTNTTNFNAASTRYIEITPSSSTDFYYLCYVHGISMGGVFDVTTQTWGALSWGANAWNSSTNLIQPTALTLSNVLGSPNIEADVNIGWGRLGYGQGEWNSSVESIEITATALALTSTTNSVSINSEVNVGWGRQTWGENAWGISGDALASGLSMNTNQGSVSVTAEVNQGWGRGKWGEQVWGEPNEAGALTGQAISTNIGTVSITAVINEGWGRLGWGDADWGEPAGETIQVTGFGLTSKVNQKEVAWGAQTWGFSTTSVIDVISSAEPTGQSMSLALNSVFVDGSIIQNVTGITISTAIGNEEADPNTIVAVTGRSLNTTAGVVFAGGTTVVIPTGDSMSTSTGTLSATIWTEIDPNVSMVWTELAA
jgi:hypothetical protein